MNTPRRPLLRPLLLGVALGVLLYIGYIAYGMLP